MSSEDAPFRAQPPPLPVELEHPRGLPEIQAAVLDNGLSLWVVRRPGLPVVTLSMIGREAGTFDTSASAELVGLTARAILDGGTVWHDGRTVSSPPLNGRTVWLHAGRTFSAFSLRFLQQALPDGFDILDRTVRAPAFAAGLLDQVRLAQLKEIQNAAHVSGLLLQVTLEAGYGKAAAEQLLGLSMERVRTLDLGAIRRCYQAKFRPESLLLFGVGDVTLEELRELAEPTLGTWHAEGAPEASDWPATFPPLSTARRVHFLPQSGDAQASILLLQPAPASTAPRDVLPFALLSELAVGAVRSRVNMALRHTGGVTYGVRPRLLTARRMGLLTIELDVEAEQTLAAISGLLGELARLQRAEVTANELRLSKIALSAELERRFDDHGSQVDLAAEMFASGRSPEWLRTLPAAIDAVTPADLLRVAREYLRPGQLELGVSGSPDLAVELASIGELATYEVERKDK